MTNAEKEAITTKVFQGYRPAVERCSISEMRRKGAVILDTDLTENPAPGHDPD